MRFGRYSIIFVSYLPYLFYGLADHLNSLSQGRPCNRCIKRRISHLCHDEARESAISFSVKKNETNENCEASPVVDPISSDVVSSHIDVLSRITRPAQNTIVEACLPSTIPTSQADCLKLNSSTKGYGAESRLLIPSQHCKLMFCISMRFAYVYRR